MSHEKRTADKRSNKKVIDARVRRTRDALGDALISLMQTQPFESITIQNVLDRARISRSTFYKHFSDKDDLLISDTDELFEFFATTLRRGETSDRVFPVKEFLTHVRAMRPLLESLTASGKLTENLQLAQRHFARGIEQRLVELPRARAVPPPQRAAIAHAQAGALLSLLDWWMDRETSLSPVDMDDLYHRMFWSGINGI